MDEPGNAPDRTGVVTAGRDEPAAAWSEPRTADVGRGISLGYEELGPADGPPVVLVMGLGTQMLAWPDPLCADLAGRGYRVIRFDNRDCGLSTHLPGPAPSPVQALLGRGPYRVQDMAEDLRGLLDALGIDSAHVVGASMGGFIAQELAILHPDRVRSLGLVMTSTGSRLVGRVHPRIAPRLLKRRRAAGRDAAVDLAVETFTLIGSRGYALDEEWLRGVAGRSYDRAHDPRGYLRQLAACAGQRDRTRLLRRVAVPTVVIHGLADPLVGPSGGVAIARAVPGARFVGYAGMGHDLPRPLWGPIAAELAEVVERGEQQRTAAA